ncbi:energy-coupling factor ABC transporter ATP-binding protein [Budvicia aquatica]|uniref:energy-coupling factor ABC transporter ATP-binding protein n=1 Tax=Budvicia aquatica TaxID=82979 RepID=UPI002083E3BF|nr:hypothetical protein SOASR029_33060 [Budvicia aquatica]
MTELIRLNDLRVLRDGKTILNNVEMVLSAGERLAIVGPNGVGKTTLLRTIAGLEYPEAGEVILFGQACKREAEFRIQRPRIGFLFQESDDQLFCPSVIEDVAFGPCNTGMSNQEARQCAAETLDKLGIAHLAERFTHRLSGGRNDWFVLQAFSPCGRISFCLMNRQTASMLKTVPSYARHC